LTPDQFAVLAKVEAKPPPGGMSRSDPANKCWTKRASSDADKTIRNITIKDIKSFNRLEFAKKSLKVIYLFFICKILIALSILMNFVSV
jgi:hypothetical protein